MNGVKFISFMFFADNEEADAEESKNGATLLETSTKYQYLPCQTEQLVCFLKNCVTTMSACCHSCHGFSGNSADYSHTTASLWQPYYIIMQQNVGPCWLFWNTEFDSMCN